MKNKLILLLAVACAGIWTCEKEYEVTAVNEDLSNQAFVRVIHGVTSMNTLFNVRDTFNLFLNGTRLNPTPLAFGTTYPAATSQYFSVPAGNQAIRLASVNGTNPDAATITTLNKSLKAGEYYTFVVTDSVQQQKDSMQIWVRDSFPNIAPGFYGLRLIHAVLNDTANRSIDLYSARRNGNIFTNVKPATISNFVAFPYNAAVNDTLIVKRTGTNFELARLNAVSFGNQRHYTITYRGHGDSTSAKRYGRNLLVTSNK